MFRGWASLVAETRDVCSEGAGAFLTQLSAWLSTEYIYTSTPPLQATEHAGKRTKPEGDPSNPETNPATGRELEDRIAELSKESAVLEKVVFARLPIQLIWNPSAMIVLLVSSIIAFQPGTSQQRTRRRDEQDSFRRFGRVARRVQPTLDGTRSLRWLGGAPS